MFVKLYKTLDPHNILVNQLLTKLMKSTFDETNETFLVFSGYLSRSKLPIIHCFLNSAQKLVFYRMKPWNHFQKEEALIFNTPKIARVGATCMAQKSQRTKLIWCLRKIYSGTNLGTKFKKHGLCLDSKPLLSMG